MKILSYGSLNIDQVYRVEHIVKAGETISVLNFFQNPGGKGLNLSIAISRAGSKVYHSGLVGNDGEILLKTLEDNDVDITYVDKITGQSGQAIIQVSNDGENSILVNGGSNLKHSHESIDRVLFSFNKNDIIILQNEINNIKYIIDKAYEKGLTIVLNPSPFNKIINDIDLRKIDYIVLNEIEGKLLTKKDNPVDIINKLLTSYLNIKVVLTLGAEGVYFGSSEEIIKVDAYKTSVVDTTAAGDTFLGYFISQIYNKSTTKKALEIASKAASVTVSRNGASNSIPYFSELNIPKL